MATVVNLEAVRGDDFSLNFSMKNTNDEPVDITGWVFSMTIKDKTSRDDEDAVFQKDVSVHTDPINGKSILTITHVESYELHGVYKYDVQIKTSTNLVKTLMYGTMKFIEDVTRRY